MNHGATCRVDSTRRIRTCTQACMPPSARSRDPARRLAQRRPAPPGAASHRPRRGCALRTLRCGDPPGRALDTRTRRSDPHSGHRRRVRVTAAPQPDQLSLDHIPERITVHEPTRRGPVILVEDAAAGDPAAFAAVATDLIPSTADSYSF